MKLFISYSRVDLARCEELVKILSRSNEVWYDQRLFTGDEWWPVIQEKLAWCEGFIYLLSPEAVVSKYCLDEFNLAKSANKLIFPTLIRARTTIPDDLSIRHYVDLSYDNNNLHELLGAIQVREREMISRSIPAAPMIAHMPENPHQQLAQATQAMEETHFDNAVFLLKRLLEQANLSKFILKPAQEMLAEAEGILARQVYEREAAYHYEPIAVLVKSKASRKQGCIAFNEFRAEYPDYDPQHLAELCEPPKPLTAADHAALVRQIIGGPFEWCEIPTGKVTLVPDEQDKKDSYLKKTTNFEVPVFWMAKYPITNGQFTKFIVAGGYEDSQWWGKAGWEARLKGYVWDSKASDWKESGQPWELPRYWEDAKFNGAEQPVVGNSFWESMAFGRWLTAQIPLPRGGVITLPTEQQWQRAAQGDDGRVYPWGNTFDKAKCNTFESGLGKTMQVTAYPQGASSFEVVDMAGNVWEWCSTLYEAGDSNANNINKRVLRGGSWSNYFSSARAAFRFLYDPRSRLNLIGFRVVCPSAPI